MADCWSQSEARNATPGLRRSTSPSGDAAGEGANHRTNKRFCRYKLAQGTTIFTISSRPTRVRPIAKRLTIKLGPKDLPQTLCAWAADRWIGRGEARWLTPLFPVSGSGDNPAAKGTDCTTLHDHLASNVCHLDVETGGCSRGERRASFGGFMLLPRVSDSSTPVRLKSGPWSLGTLRSQPAGATRLASPLPLRAAKNFESI